MNDFLICDDNSQRRQDVRRHRLNGLDYLEVGDDGRTLTVTFLGKAPGNLTPANVRITGGRRTRDVRAVELRYCHRDDPEIDDCLDIIINHSGDMSPYTLCIVEVENGRATGRLHPAFDRRYACLEFSFAAACDTGLDCKAQAVCLPALRDEPEIDYLAKDYASFRQLILDRLAVLLPDWQERHVPDIGITLVELLAYAGDHLSYYQDAVATEAYLDTARSRISVRRHARLVDYAMHDGCNARAWVHIRASQDVSLPAGSFYLVTRFEADGALPPPPGRVLTEESLPPVAAGQYEVFEPLFGADLELAAAHNTISLYTWGDRECCLPAGSTAATLLDRWLPQAPQLPEPQPGYGDKGPAQVYGAKEESPAERQRRLRLKKGDLLLFEELLGPETGDPADADPTHRHVVRLTEVTRDVDPLYDQPIVHVTWDAVDALPFSLCISAIGPAPACDLLTDISVARGNLLLVDHGRSQTLDLPDPVPGREVPPPCDKADCPPEVTTVPGIYRPILDLPSLTLSQALPPGSPPAAHLLWQEPRQALPHITLEASHPALPPGNGHAMWTPRRDLLASQPGDQHFVVELEEDGRAHLRFGDGELGRQPATGTRFCAFFRQGNGPAGNVGAESISYVVSRRGLQSGLSLEPRNPLPAVGGTAPEPLVEVKLLAPFTLRRELQRAIVAEDYAALVQRAFAGRVQRAAAVLRWNGSWYEVLVAVDARGRVDVEPALLSEVEAFLYPYRRIGHDLAVAPARHVPVSLELEVCVRPTDLRGHVKAALLAVLGTGVLPDGRRGFFHPDELTFGQGIAVSRLVAAVQKVPGVESVRVRKLQRLGRGDNGELAAGFLPVGPLEVVRLDNDPSQPENGALALRMEGGR